MDQSGVWEVIIVGGGLAGLSAAIYLGRALRRVLVIDDEKSLALWEPDAQNYLGFPEGVAGVDLLRRGHTQARHYGAQFVRDRVRTAARGDGCFQLDGDFGTYRCHRLLLASGLYHLPPEIPGVSDCLGRSMFFCKDCDAYRVQGKRIAIIGWNHEAVEYALAILLYSPCVIIATNGRPAAWDHTHSQWIAEYEIPVFPERIIQVEHDCGAVYSIAFANQSRFAVDAIFTTRGDLYHNALAQGLGAETDRAGEVVINADCETTVSGFYAAGCVTPANCQMIIAAGQGATAAQAINRDLFEQSLKNHSLRSVRQEQIQTEQVMPEPVP